MKPVPMVSPAAKPEDFALERFAVKLERFTARAGSGLAPSHGHVRGALREAAALVGRFAATVMRSLPGGFIAGAASTACSPARDARGGHVALVGAGAGCADLITMRGVQRLQDAEVIFYDRLLDDRVLDYANPRAERICVGKVPGACAWPQDKINALLVAAALRGKRVVRLKCGDPGIFARGREEADALSAAGIGFEIVPGVTAASVASSSMGGFLTERGETDTLVLSTAACRVGDTPPDLTRFLHPGTTLALYMSVAAAPKIERSLLAAGHAPTLDVEIVSNADRPDMRVARSPLRGMSEAMREAGIANPALIIIRQPKGARSAVHAPVQRVAALV